MVHLHPRGQLRASMRLIQRDGIDTFTGDAMRDVTLFVDSVVPSCPFPTATLL